MTTELRKSLCAAATLLAVLSASAAFAQRSPQPPGEALWRNECGSCHVPYPPRLLTAADWRALMTTLDRHFGDDASVDAKTGAGIGRFLEARAGRRPGGESAGLPRITAGPWFAKEHREVSQRTWDSPKVKSPANCGACHRGAAWGHFDEADITLPR